MIRFKARCTNDEVNDIYYLEYTINGKTTKKQFYSPVERCKFLQELIIDVVEPESTNDLELCND